MNTSLPKRHVKLYDQICFKIRILYVTLTSRMKIVKQFKKFYIKQTL